MPKLILSALSFCILLLGAGNLFSLLLGRNTVKRALKKSLSTDVKLLAYKREYNWAILPPQPFGFGLIYLQDKEHEINFISRYNYRKTRYTSAKDTLPSLVDTIHRDHKKALIFDGTLKAKAKLFKHISDRDCFVSYNTNHKMYQIVLFLDKDNPFFEHPQKVLTELEHYLFKNPADSIVCIPETYKKYFTHILKRSYFAHFEIHKGDSQKALHYPKIQSKENFSSLLPFISSYRLAYTDQKTMQRRIASYQGSAVQQARGGILQYQNQPVLNGSSTLDISIGAQTKEHIKNRYLALHNTILDINCVDSFLIVDNDRFIVEIYDCSSNQEEGITIRYLQYDFVHDQFMEYMQEPIPSKTVRNLDNEKEPPFPPMGKVSKQNHKES